jgi:hypothetical protein
MDRDVDGQVRDTFHSSLRLAEMSLIALDIAPDAAARAVTLFRDQDEANLIAVHAIYRDEAQVIQSTKQATEELIALFEADRESPSSA